MKVLVIGASLNEDRYSNKAIKMLKQFDHTVFAIGLRNGQINGVNIDTDKPNYETLNTITLYLNPKRQVAYYEYIIGLKPKRVIFNPGTENEHFYKLLDAADIFYEEACTLVLLRTNQFEIPVIN
jgi:predicted CoA-binding protein